MKAMMPVQRCEVYSQLPLQGYSLTLESPRTRSKPVEPVKQQRNEDEDPLQHVHKRQAGEELHLVVVGLDAIGRFGIGDEVLDQKRADGHDAGQ